MTKFSLRYMCTQFMNMKLSKTKLELFRICDGAMVRVLGRNKGGIQSRLTQICELERVLRCTGTRTHTPLQRLSCPLDLSRPSPQLPHALGICLSRASADKLEVVHSCVHVDVRV